MPVIGGSRASVRVAVFGHVERPLAGLVAVHDEIHSLQVALAS